MKVRTFAAGLLAAGIACEGAPAPPQTITVTDSAGITVVFNPSPESDTVPPHRTSDTPLISIGSAQTEAQYNLFDVNGGALLSDGRIVLANTGTYELRFYDSTGTHLRTVGGEGSGPGEFRLLRWGGTFGGDSIVAVDGLLRRATVFDSSGSYVRSFMLPDDVTRPLADPLGVLSQGGILFAPRVRDSVPPAARWTVTGIERRQRQPLVVWPDGRVDTVGDQRPGEEWYRDVEARSQVRVPLGRRLYGTAAGERIALGSNDSFRIDVYDRNYRPSTVIVQHGKERKVVDEDYWTVAEAEVLADLTMPSARASAHRTLEELARPVSWPRYLAIRLDRQGNLWVRESVDTEGQFDLWSTFDWDGRLTGRWHVPEGLEILDIRNRMVLGLTRDETGVERVEVLRLIELPQDET